MKKIVGTLIMGTMAMAASADLIGGWETYAAPSVSNQVATATGPINAALTMSFSSQGADWNRNAAAGGSDDLTFGGSGGLALGNSGNVNDGFVSRRISGAFLDFTITNNDVNDLIFDGFHFDVWRLFTGSINRYELDVISGSSITVGNVVTDRTLGGANGGTVPPENANFADIDVNLSNMADRTLAMGESATFRMTISRAGNPGPVYFDNIAFTGHAAIPEPSTLALVGMGCSLLFVRRRTWKLN